MIRSSAAEFLGTFLLAFLVHLSLGSTFPLSTPVIAALTVLCLVYMVGPISGAHLNPAVTVGLASIGKISLQQALCYIVAQCAAGLLASIAGSAFLGSSPTLTADSTLMIAAAEAIGAGILVLGVSSVVFGIAPKEASGMTIGTALLIAILAASVQSNGVLNPAVAIGIGSVSIAYILGPIVGGVIAAWVYKSLVR